MTKNQLLILATVLVLIYLYWKYQANKTLPPNPDDIIERKGKEKEVFFDAEDWEVNSDNVTKDNLGNSLPDLARPILSHKQKRQLKKQQKK